MIFRLNQPRTRRCADVALKRQNGLERPSTGVLHHAIRQDARIYCLAARWHYAGPSPPRKKGGQKLFSFDLRADNHALSASMFSALRAENYCAGINIR